jgi:hypothetical protein
MRKALLADQANREQQGRRSRRCIPRNCIVPAPIRPFLAPPGDTLRGCVERASGAGANRDDRECPDFCVRWSRISLF